MRFVTLRYKFTKKQWIYWISWIPDQIFWSLDMAWSQTRTIRSKADRNFNPRKFRGKNIQIYVFTLKNLTSHEIFKFTHVFALVKKKLSIISWFLRQCVCQNPVWSHSFSTYLHDFSFELTCKEVVEFDDFKCRVFFLKSKLSSQKLMKEINVVSSALSPHFTSWDYFDFDSQLNWGPNNVHFQ